MPNMNRMGEIYRALCDGREQFARRVGDTLPKWVWILLEGVILLGPFVFCAVSLVYLAACGWAVYNGYASFAGWPLRQIETILPIYWFNARLAVWLRDWAVVTWVALILCFFVRRAPAEQIVRRLERIWLWLGLPAITALFLFHTGCGWAAPEQAVSGYALVGQVPYNDAGAHYQYPFWFTLEGTFKEWIMRRPMACQMRLGLDLLAGWNPQRIIALQASLLGLSTWLLGVAVSRRWGFFSAVVSCSFIFLFCKNFLLSFMVETLGLIWVCLFVVLCLNALYARSRVSAFGALAALTVTLSIRMGAMFLLPAFLLWLIVRFWNGWRGAAAQACLGLALVGVFLGASQAVSAIYSNAGLQGANFAPTLASLTLRGKNYRTALEIYEEQLAGKSEKEQASFLYAEAWKNIRRQPEILAAGLADRAKAFCRSLPRLMQRGHSKDKDIGLFFWILPVLALWSLWRARPQQRLFWLLAMAAMTASAAVTYFDSGTRALLPGYVLFGIFLAMGLKLPFPDRESTTSKRFHRPALVMGGLLLLLMFSAPTLAVRFPPEAVRFLRLYHTPPARDEALVWGGGSMAGVLVMPDNAPLPTDAPAVSLSSFVLSIKKINDERIQPLVTPEPPEPPFIFIRGVSFFGTGAYIGPPDMLLRPEVPVWRVQYAELPGPSLFWKRVVKAEPLGE